MDPRISQGVEDSSAPRFLTVGRVVAPRGVKGEVKVEVTTDFPERFSPGQVLFVAGQPRRIEHSSSLKQMLSVKLEGVDSRDEAERLRHAELEIPVEAAMPLPEGEYYHFQILGLAVWTSQGRYLGQVVDIFPTGSNDVYVVRSPDREILLPAIEDVVLSIDLPAGRLVIEPIAGLLED